MTTKNFVLPDAAQEDDAPLIVIDDPTVNLHYNYELLPPDVRNDAMAAAVTIRRKDAQATGLAWEIGGILNSFKDRIPYGQWAEWTRIEFGYAPRTVQKLMQINRELPNPGKLATLSTSVLALLAAETTDPTIIDAVAAQVEAGGHPTYADVRRLVDENNGRIPQGLHDDRLPSGPLPTPPRRHLYPTEPPTETGPLTPLPNTQQTYPTNGATPTTSTQRAEPMRRIPVDDYVPESDEPDQSVVMYADISALRAAEAIIMKYAGTPGINNNKADETCSALVDLIAYIGELLDA